LPTSASSPKEAATAAAAAWSTAHGFATLALEEKFGSVRSAAGLREVMKTLNRVLDYLWPASDAHRYTARIKA
jgi:hypothetical protein